VWNVRISAVSEPFSPILNFDDLHYTELNENAGRCVWYLLCLI
jgi:hypothetical protein